MSEDTTAPAPDAPPVESLPTKMPVPHPWLPLLLGFAGLTAAAIVCVLLISHFFNSRTMNLLGYSEQMANNLEQLLVINRVPQDNIRRAQGHLEQDSSVRWYSYEFDVTVPRGLNAAGLAQVVHKNMPSQNMVVSDLPSPDAYVRSLTLALGGRQFAVLRLHSSQSVSLQPEDETGACEWIVNQVVAALQRCHPALGSIDRRAPVKQSQGETVWTLTRVRTTMPESLTVAAVRRAIDAALTDPDVRIEEQAAPVDGEHVLTVSYKGLDCLRLTLAQEFTAAPAALPPVELPSVSSPDEMPEMREAAAEPLPGQDELLLESDEFEGASAEPTAFQESTPREKQPQTPSMASVPKTDAPRVAIIVDDGGYGGPVTDTILGLDRNLTLAILPHCPHSTETAERAADLGFEVMLHMPMESDSKRARFPGTIKTDMTRTQIQQATDTALQQVAHAVGINNHTGSKFTSDRKSLLSLFDVLKSRGLYFIDSRTTATTVAYEVALELGVPAGKRDVFLDNQAKTSLIRQQIQELVEIAKSQGSAIGICHFRPTTAEVLAEMLPTLEASNVRLVPASELVQ
jgi:polysaccharide deacetylase 2 family uncharacterized protein YibQ